MNTKVMLDLETLGTRPGCKIVSISAVTFGINRNFQFDVFIKIDSQPLLHTEPATYNWWMKQDPVLMKFTLENPHAVPLTQALYMFSEWYRGLPGREKSIWGNSAAFDCGILRAAYEYLGIDVPWDTHRAERCYRTLKSEFGSLVKEPAFEGQQHRGLHDARHQADYANQLLNFVFNRR